MILITIVVFVGELKKKSVLSRRDSAKQECGYSIVLVVVYFSLEWLKLMMM